MKERLLALLIGGACGLVLYLAIILEPSETGIGTHQQLGIPACGFWVMTEHPCPMCGMTTTFALASDGALVKAILNQPFGFFLYFTNLLLLMICGIEIVSPRKRILRLWRIFRMNGQKISWYLLGALMLSWIYKIFSI